MATYKVMGNISSKKNGLAVAFAKVEILQVVKVGTDYQVTPLAALPGSQDVTDNTGAFSVLFDHVAAPKPSIVIRISQTIDGAVKYIYNENPVLQTRKNIGNVVGVNIKVEEECITMSPIADPGLSDYKFVFTRVGNVGVNKIDQTSGLMYPFPSAPPSPANDLNNAPLGGCLNLGGWLNCLCDATVDLYQIQYQKSGEIGWHNIENPLYNTYYDFLTHTWKTVPLGPFHKPSYADGTQVYGLYKLITSTEKAVTPWQFPDLLAAWYTPGVTDGKYTLRIQGYKEFPPGCVTPTPSWGLVPEQPTTGQLIVNIDNSQPVCEITEVRQGNWDQPFASLTPVGACAKVNLVSGKKLAVKFKAYDEKGFLYAYNLAAYYGHNQVVIPPPSSPNKAKDSYAAHAGAVAWTGSQEFIIEYIADTGGVSTDVSYSNLEMPPCAYQFRLTLAKRTNNGYGLVYHGYEDNIHLTIER
jgi:hypothetical protein